MDLGRMVNMILRIVSRRAVEIAVNKAIDLAARRGKAGDVMTAEERAAAKASKENMGRVRQMMRVARRMIR